MKSKMLLGAILICSCASVSNGVASSDPPLSVSSILYADRDVEVGSEITISDLKIHWIPRDKKPSDALETFTQAVALKAKNKLVKDQIISDFDVVNLSNPQNKTLVVLRLENSLAKNLKKASLKKKISQSQLCEAALTEYFAKRRK